MAFDVRDKEAERLVRHLASKMGVSLTQAIKSAVQNELHRMNQMRPLLDRLEPILSRLRGKRIDDVRSHKQYWDELSDDNSARR